MKTNTLFTLAAMTAVLASCSNEMEDMKVKDEANAVQFEMGVTASTSTRTSTGTDYETKFVANDQVGIFATDRTGGTVVSANEEYKLEGETWKHQGNGIYSEAGKTFSYYAYYPYATGVTSPEAISMTVAADQSTEAAYNKSDVLAAKNEEVAAEATKVVLKYKHVFALVQVNLKGSLATKDAKVKLLGVYPTAKVNAKTQTAGAAEGTQGNIQMLPIAAINDVAKATQFAFRAIVPAQEIAANNAILEIAASNGKTYRFTWDSKVGYVSGAIRVINVTLGDSGENTIDMPAGDSTVDKWGNSESVSGSGSSSEVETPREPIPNLITVPVSTVTEIVSYAAVADWDNDIRTGDKTKLQDSYWYEILGDAASFESSLVSGAINIKATTRTAWNKGVLGFHYYPGAEGTAINSKACLKLTVKVKAASKVQLRAIIRDSFEGDPDSDGPLKVKYSWFYPEENKEFANVGINVTTDELEYSKTFDVSKLTSNSGTSTTSDVTTVEDNASLPNVLTSLDLRLYPNAEADITITEVRLEPCDATPAASASVN